MVSKIFLNNCYLLRHTFLNTLIILFYSSPNVLCRKIIRKLNFYYRTINLRQ